MNPYRTAAECIDWSIPCPSIFERKRPLADNTLRRIAAGIQRYVLDSADPFIISIANYGGGVSARSVGDPLSTVTANPKGGHHAVCTPTLVNVANSKTTGRGPNTWDMRDPLRTVTASPGFAVISPTLVQTGYGERKGQAPRVPGLEKPLGTVVAGGSKHALVSAFMAKHYGGMVGCPIDTPAPTQTTRGTQNQVVAAHLTHLYTSNTRGGAGDLTEPIKTVTAGGNHAGLVAALLVKYYGTATGQQVDEPLHAVTTKHRYGLVTVELDGEPYVITDIGMRMLQPRELYRAQGFGDDYIIERGIDRDGEVIGLTKTAQVRMCGNSVCPPAAEALVRANVSEVAAIGGVA